VYSSSWFPISSFVTGEIKAGSGLGNIVSQEYTFLSSSENQSSDFPAGRAMKYRRKHGNDISREISAK
jgi:hypothetical protein